MLEIVFQRVNQILLLNPRVCIALQNPCVMWNQIALSQIR